MVEPADRIPESGDVIREEIARLEARIEALNDSLARCGKISLMARLILAGGAVWIVLIALGAVRFGSFNIVGAIAAVLGGIVLFGSNSSTWKQTDAALAAAQARRSELIDAIEMRTVDDADPRTCSGAVQSRRGAAD